MILSMQACFTKEWAQLVEASFRNFLAEAVERMPLPAVLRFDADRQQRLELQEQCRSLQSQNAQLKQASRWFPFQRPLHTSIRSESDTQL